jgi:hypothetical protein
MYPLAGGGRVPSAPEMIQPSGIIGDVTTFRAKIGEWPLLDAARTTPEIDCPGSDDGSHSQARLGATTTIVSQSNPTVIENNSDPNLLFHTSKSSSSRPSFTTAKRQVSSFSATSQRPTSSAQPFVPIAPSPSIPNTHWQPSSQVAMSLSPTLSHPLPLRRSSLLAPSLPLTDTMSVRADGHSIIASKLDSFPFDGGLGIQASSLTATSPGLTFTPKGGFSDLEETCLIPADDTFEDPLSLLHYLAQVDLSQYLKRESPQDLGITKRSVNHSASWFSASDSIPAVEAFSRIERDFMDAVRRKSQQYHDSTDWHALQEKSASLPPRRATMPVTPKSKQTNSALLMAALSPTMPSSPKTPVTPRVPYKGRFGLHPVCGACKTDKTPYWRDSWSSLFIALR